MTDLTHFKPHTERLRETTATKRRDGNVRLILDMLHHGSMLKDDIRDTMHLSQSGINKYCQLLRHAGVIEIERCINRTRFSPGTPVFRLARERGVVDAYLKSLDEGGVRKAPAKDPTRHVHRLEDEGPYPDRLPTISIPAPDPLLAHFFGMSTAAAA